jgi:hypothetical protein
VAIYKALGLSRNPFAWVDDEDPGPFLDHLHLETPRPGASRLLQLIGVKGAGKSTHLKHWQSVTGGPYYHMEPVGHADPPLGPIVYWDEADRLSDRQLRGLFSAALKMQATVVAGTHRDLKKPAKASGLDCSTVEFGVLPIAVLREWCRARIEASSIGAPEVVVSDDVLLRVISEVHGSLRDAGDLLHVWIAQHARVATAAQR